MMTGPCSTLALRDPVHERNHERPCGKDVGIEHRHAEDAAADVEKREDREIEEHQPEHAEGEEALVLVLVVAHQVNGGGRTIVTLHGACAATCSASLPPLLAKAMRISSTSCTAA